MKKREPIKENRGITLISVVITVIVIIIIASIATYSGISAIQSNKFTEYKTELEIMQTQVNYLGEAYIRAEKNGEGESFLNRYGKELTNSEEEKKAFEAAGVTDTTGYKYFDKETLEELSLDGMKYEFLVNIKERKVIGIKGFEYGGTKYHTIDQIRESPKSGGLERRELKVDSVDYEHLGGEKYKIKIKNVQCSQYVEKYTINCKCEEEGGIYTSIARLITGKDYEFEVEGEGTYTIQIVDAAGATGEYTITIKKYTLRYDANTGSGAPAAQTKYHGHELKLSTIEPTKTGYDFMGWAETSTETTAKYQVGGTYTKNEDITLYAVWKIKTYTISYDAKDGKGAPANQTKTWGVDLILSTTKPTPNNNTYEFKGWSTTDGGEVDYEAGATYTSNADVKLYAVYKLKTYTINYDANGGENAPSSQIKTYGQTLTLTNQKPTRTGYDFQGWSESSNGTVQYQAGGSYTKNEAKTLYAIWKLKTYTISYNANGGSGAPGSQTKTHGQNITLSTTIPTGSNGAKFLNWNTKQDGTGTTYASGGTYSDNANVTLYAQWQKDTTPPTITGAKVIIIGGNLSAKIAITATDDNSGIVGYAVTTNNSKPSSFTSVNNTKSLSVTETGLLVNRTYYIWAKDDAGNINSGYSVTTKALAVGDYVNYTYDSAGTYAVTPTMSGDTKTQTVTQTRGLNWRIMNINSDGTIDLKSDFANIVIWVPFYLGNGNLNGYYNLPNTINDICANLYSNSSLSLTGRSLTGTDIRNAIKPTYYSKFDDWLYSYVDLKSDCFVNSIVYDMLHETRGWVQ